MLQKNFCKITFLNSYKNVYDRNAVSKNVLAISVITKSSVKLGLSTIIEKEMKYLILIF